MRYTFKAACVLMAGIVGGQAQAAETLKGDALRRTISGKTVFVATPAGLELPIRYRGGGSMTGFAGAQLASLAGEKVASDRGRWWIADNKLCQKWNNWFDAKTSCYTFTLSGNRVRWHRSDGERGTARIG